MARPAIGRYDQLVAQNGLRVGLSRYLGRMTDDDFPMDTGGDLFHFTDGAIAYAGYHTHDGVNALTSAANIDITHDNADGDRKLSPPLLALWGANGTVGRCFDVLELWRNRAQHVEGKPLPSGHYIPEECPDELAERLLAFFA